MKNKLIILGIILLLITISYIAGSETLKGNKVIDQHIKYKDKNQCSSNESEFCTHLPLVMIDTKNQDIPFRMGTSWSILG